MREQAATILTFGETRFALSEPAAPLPAQRKDDCSGGRPMLNPNGPGALRTQPQAVRHPSPTRNEVNGANQGTRNLPGSVVVSQRGAVTLVRLSRPAKRNALDTEMVAGIETIFSSPPEGTRAIVVHGEGSHFCAGADLAMFAETDGAAAMRLSRMAHQALDRIEYAAVPVVAALHGAVIGGGLEIAAAAHIRVAERNAFYALPEGMRGIFVGGGGSVRLPRLIGTSRMIDMMLTGRTYGATEGASLGFSQYVVEDGQGVSTAIELAERIAANAALTNFAVVQALPRIARCDPDAGLLMESLMWALATNDADAKARIHDFLEKRAAKVSHGSEPGLPMPPFDSGEQRR
jgi:enoyl-CoA hydratase/carnithine racemase